MYVKVEVRCSEVRVRAETIAIKRALVHADNNISQAAKLLGVTRPTLYTLFSKYDINGHEGTV
ncbi:hypothetical protein BMR07_01205 [Methylococcaceae bacterium CS1]|nr:hypothetical protein BMR10_16250 [Methylococcaceae bacterium CS4]TXK93601.1 hypothetical protein BMR11_16650 [Methylococcaceae bacterium CS5]TXL02837.1 hypothetical protein BMR09_16085 [Methylococcaceae bacterium CS3]TXL08780.1 hypothetical protein BMR07_01205 [Methylococcaceae bacterium CS1]